jgi:hypothetical protein
MTQLTEVIAAHSTSVWMLPTRKRSCMADQDSNIGLLLSSMLNSPPHTGSHQGGGPSKTQSAGHNNRAQQHRQHTYKYKCRCSHPLHDVVAST